MFRRKFIWFGPIRSDRGFALAFSHKTLLYTDDRGKFAFGYEDNYLNPKPYQVSGPAIVLSPEEEHVIVDRIVARIRSTGGTVYVCGN